MDGNKTSDMRWTVLSDNRSCDNSLKTEHGLSILLETEHHKILLDTGASDVFIRNAERMNIDLRTVDYVFISHGHCDHAGGLKHFMAINDKAKVIVSPEALCGKFFSKRRYLHSITTEWPERMQERLLLVDKTCEISDGIHILANIPQIYLMPKGNQHLYVQNAEGDYLNDDFRHELALYTDGLLFTGCAHSGLENILAACPWPVNTVLGGFHLLDEYELTEMRVSTHSFEPKFDGRRDSQWPRGDSNRKYQSDNNVTALGKKLIEAYPDTQFYTSHCTGDAVFAYLKGLMGEQIHAFSCGMIKEYK